MHFSHHGHGRGRLLVTLGGRDRLLVTLDGRGRLSGTRLRPAFMYTRGPQKNFLNAKKCYQFPPIEGKTLGREAAKLVRFFSIKAFRFKNYYIFFFTLSLLTYNHQKMLN